MSKFDVTEINSKYLGQVNSTIFPIIEKSDLTFISSYTGSGKTTFLVDFVKSNENAKVLFINVNITNCHQVVSSASKIGLKIQPYMKLETCTVKEKEMEDRDYNLYFFKNIKKFKIVSVNCLSLHRLMNSNMSVAQYDYIIIDEVSSVIPNISCPIDSYDVNMLISAWESFILLMQSKAKILCLDGNIQKNLVSCLENVSSKKSSVIRNLYKPEKHADIYYSNLPRLPQKTEPTFSLTMDKFLLSMKKSVESKSNKFLVSSTNRTLLMELYKRCIRYEDTYLSGILQYENVGGSGDSVAVASGTLPANTNITEHVHKFKRVFYSPSITTAVDIKGFENKTVYHLLGFPGLSSTINYQMINRARNTKRVRIIVDSGLMIQETRSTIKPTMDHFMSIVVRYLYSTNSSHFKKIVDFIKYGKYPKLNYKGEKMKDHNGRTMVEWKLRYNKTKLDEENKYLALWIKAYGQWVINNNLISDTQKDFKNNELCIPEEFLEMGYLVYSTQQNDYFHGMFNNFLSKLESENYSITEYQEFAGKIENKLNYTLKLKSIETQLRKDATKIDRMRNK